jgi:hypothetical protein
MWGSAVPCLPSPGSPCLAMVSRAMPACQAPSSWLRPGVVLLGTAVLRPLSRAGIAWPRQAKLRLLWLRLALLSQLRLAGNFGGPPSPALPATLCSATLNQVLES